MMKDPDRRCRIGEIIYLIYFVLMTGARALGMYEGTLSYTIVLLIAIALFAAHMIITPHTVPEYILAALILAISGIVYLHTGEKGLIVCFMTLLGMKCVDRVRVIRYGAYTAAICIGFRIITGVFGILPEKYYPQVREGIGLMFRHALGYAHPNTLHMCVFLLGTLVIYSLTMKLKNTADETLSAGNRTLLLALVSILVLAFNLYVFQYSGSRTGVLAAFVYLAVNFWFYLRSVPGIPEKAVCFLSYPGVCFIAIVLPHILPESIFDVIDRTVFTTRLTIARYYWSNNDLSLWGIRLANPLPEYRTYGIDMAHMYLFLQLGLVAFALISIMTIGFVYLALKRRWMAELAVLMGVLFAGIWEPFLYNLGFKNITYVFMGAMLYELTGQMTVKQHTAQSDPAGQPNGIYCLEQSVTTPAVLAVSTAVGILAGVLAAGAYLLATETPKALYADRQQDEAGDTFGMEELYLGESEINDIIRSGDLVVGYKDAYTPMYKYDPEIARMEYSKKTLSVGVWTGIPAAVCCLSIFKLKRRREKD